MALSVEVVEVGTEEAVALNEAGTRGISLYLVVGAKAVTIGTKAGLEAEESIGIAIAAEAERNYELDAGDQLYAIAAEASTVTVLRT